MFFYSLMSLVFSQMLWAQTPIPQSPSNEILERVAEFNELQAATDIYTGRFAERDTAADVRPFAEYEATGYVFFNDDDYWGYARGIKMGIAKNLPEDTTLVVYSTSTRDSHLRRIKEKYSQWIDPSRLVVLQVPQSGSNNFWSRDNLPIPIWSDQQFGLVDARYYYNFEPDAFLAHLFAAIKNDNPYFFEGGNFITNSRGECIVVNRKRTYSGGTSDTAAIPDQIFHQEYGCTKLTRLQHLKGIGHADEVVKFMSDDVIVTDTEEYVEILENLGYQVHMLPEPEGRFSTYINALQVNDVLFMPVFAQDTDQEATEIYQRLNPNLTIIPLPTRRLAENAQGGIHCITMNYPPVPMRQIMRNLGGRLLVDR